MSAHPSHEDLQKRIRALEQQTAADQESIAALQESVERYRGLVDNANDLIHNVTPDGKFLYVNHAWREALGYDDAEIKNLTLMDIIDESCRNRCRNIFLSLIQGQYLDRNETLFITKDGGRITVEGRCSTTFKDGKAVAMTGIFRDISERARNEQALRESEKRYRNLFENAHDLIQFVRPDGQLLYVNRAWRHTFGYTEEEIHGLSIFDLIAPTCQNHCQSTFRRVMSEEKVHYIDTEFVAKDGRKILIEGNAVSKFDSQGSPAYAQCIFRDVTEKRRMEAELFKAQKLESVGVFAGGIAHDFNNLLTAIQGNISIARLYLSPDDNINRRLEDTEKATLRARGLTQQLLTFAKGGAPIKKTTTITDLLKDSTSFALRGSNVRCEYHLIDAPWPIEVDTGQLSQVAQNLVINAAQAMPQGGTVFIRTCNLTLPAHNPLTLAEGRYVRITVEDQGTGIPKDKLTKIFDPYFSSKETGTGLGLAIAYSIIKKHDGLITVDSEEGNGASFSIYLPASRTQAVSTPAQAEGIYSRRGKVLVMDDDEMVQRVASEMLKYIGCETVLAGDGQEAIELYQQAKKAGEPFDLMIFDLTIPGGMGGKEAMLQLQAMDPTVKVVVSSGYANDPIMANFRDYGFSAVVPKPYNINELGKALNQLLEPQQAA